VPDWYYNKNFNKEVKPMVEELKKKPSRIQELIETAKSELLEEDNKAMVKELKELYKKRKAAAKIVQNIDREISECELKLRQDMEAMDSAS
jgi:dephospho-CoA kinase